MNLALVPAEADGILLGPETGRPVIGDALHRRA